ncbi:MAG: hypothetical protein IT455_13475, partial [Planctomycetes bacterium]|nr:hypothetical protein [Planctomycetota bacterium]
MTKRLLPPAATVLLTTWLAAQSPLVNAVNACLDATDDSGYERQRDELLARSDATGDALLAAVTTRPEPLRGETTFVLPFADTPLTVAARAPTERA